MSTPRFATPTLPEAVQGDTWGLTLRVIDGETGEPIDLTPLTLTVRVQVPGQETTILQQVLDQPDPVGGIATFEFSAAQTEPLEGSYIVEIETTDGADTETWIRATQVFVGDAPDLA